MFLLITKLVILLPRLDLRFGQLIIILVLVLQLAGQQVGPLLDLQVHHILLQPRGIRRSLLHIVQQRLIILQLAGQLANQRLMIQLLLITPPGQHLGQLVV